MKDSKIIAAKIDKGEVKVKGAKTKQVKARTVTGVNGKISDAKIVAWLKTQDEAVTSTQLRDGVGFKSRTQGRRIMRRLEKAGVVRMTTKEISDKRSIFVFEIA